MSKIKISNFGSGPDTEYETKHEWGFFCQAGSKGIVFSKKGNYTTAFFEAFPRTPKCFIRGEGTTVEEAEQQAWEKWQKIQTCTHEMERRDRTDGYAYCKHCAYSNMVFEPLTKCCKCGKPTNYTYDRKKNWYCKKHSVAMPRKLNPEWKLDSRGRRLPRKEKKMLKQGASVRLTGCMYAKVKFRCRCLYEFRANGYMLSMFSKKQVDGLKEFVKRKRI